jgi:hypothetical protein
MNRTLIKKLKARLRDFSTNLPFIVSQQVLFMLVSKSTDGQVRSLQVYKMANYYLRNRSQYLKKQQSAATNFCQHL